MAMHLHLTLHGYVKEDQLQFSKKHVLTGKFFVLVTIPDAVESNNVYCESEANVKLLSMDARPQVNAARDRSEVASNCTLSDCVKVGCPSLTILTVLRVACATMVYLPFGDGIGQRCLNSGDG
ncbi:hypothetical protein N7456_008496 [Penicillium angulare]|uniref:Uncharacterized protein n=1 Tax=Penicillium angulare TaxID=116970 RepID=A0A9W9FCL8_9EURO|nr:hypothetical protein N7456_008496 [Penicillium angulare]